MVWFMNAYDYPLNVGGKPFFSFIFPFPVMYEMNILRGLRYVRWYVHS